jgi:acyl-CoA thioester hydrolase
MSDAVTTTIPVRFRDCDAMGHVNHAVYLTYFEMAREVFFMQALGRFDLPFIIAEAKATFLSPVKPGESVVVTLAVDHIGTKSWRFVYEAKALGDGRPVCRGSTVQVAFDYTVHESVPIAPELRMVLQAHMVAGID